MSVYVDDSRIAWRDKHWSHLQADSLDELHAFAEKLGLKRSWFQHHEGRPELDHYDVTESMRKKAIDLGAIPETWREGAGRTRRQMQRLKAKESKDD